MALVVMVMTFVPLVTTVMLVNGLSKTAAMCHHPLLEPPPSWIGPLVVSTSAPKVPV